MSTSKKISQTEDFVERQDNASDSTYVPPKVHVVGKTADLLKGGKAGSLEDFAQRFKSKESG